MKSKRNRPAQALIALAAGLACASSALAQTAPVASHDVGFVVNSGQIALAAGGEQDSSNAQLAWSQEILVPNASWLRLAFDNVVLSGDIEAGTNSYIVITSMHDGYRHILNAKTVVEWNNTSAYMNGESVVVELYVHPGTGPSSIAMSHVTAGDPITPESICGTVDNRTGLNDPRVARLMPIGCTAWLISENGDANEFLTAGHCIFTTTSNGVMQFNVPLSSSGGGTISPPPEFQFPVQQSSIQRTQTGDDAARFNTFANSNTGLAPRVAMGGRAYILSNAPAASNQTVRVTGYGTTSSPVSPTFNQFGKTHTGPYTAKSGTQIRYAMDTTGGNSGSPVTLLGFLGLEFAIGIHTNGGCNSVGYNNGTDIAFSTLQGWLSNPAGTAINYSGQTCQSTILASNNGGGQDGAVYFDAVVGSNDIEVNSMLMNLSATNSQYTYDVYIAPGGFAGKESNASAWTQIGSGGGVVNPENTFTPATLFDTFTLNANTTYGMALVLNGAAHEYTNGDGTNQTFSTGGGELTLNFGSASNVPFSSSTIADRVWNGRFCFNTLTTSTCITEVGSLATGMTEIDMDNIGLGPTNVNELNNAGNPFDGDISAVSAPTKAAAAGVYNTNTSFGRALARVSGGLRIISNSGTADFDATTFDISFSDHVTEFGVEVGDWGGTFLVTFVDGNVPVGSVISTSQGSTAGAKFFEATCQFDRVVIDTGTTGGNFVLTELHVPNNCTITEINSMTVAAAEIDMDALSTGGVSVAQLNNAGTPNDGIIQTLGMPTKSTAAAGVYNTNTTFGQALARVGGFASIIDASGSAAFDAVTYDVTFDRDVTQFGVEIGDWNGEALVTYFDAGGNVVALEESAGGTSTGVQFFRSTCPFRRVNIDVNGSGGNFVITELWTEAAIASCYADCDGSGGLNILDYICFGDAFAAGQPYADCDGSGSLNILDYICFGDEFAAGCP